MKLPFKRSKPKKAQAAEVLRAAAKLWSELQLTKRASKGIKKGSKKASSAKKAVGSKAGTKPAKVAAGLALLGGVGAFVARTLKGRGAEPLPYVPPPSNGGAAPSDPEPPSPIAAAPPAEPPIVVEQKPIELEDLAAPDGDPEEPAGEEPASEGPGADEFNDDDEGKSR